MFYFMKNDHKIIARFRWGSGPVVSSTTGSWQSPGWGSGGNFLKKNGLFKSVGKTNSLK